MPALIHFHKQHCSLLIAAGYFLALFFVPGQGLAQVEEPATGELLENFFRDSEQASETDAQLLLEQLEYLRQHPLNLNRATREDLAALCLLNEIQIENFLNYRAQFGPLLNVYELQAVPAWEVPDIRRVLPFAGVSTGLDTRNVPLWRGLVQGEEELILRWGRQYPPNYHAAAEGDPNTMAIRYRHTFDNRMRFGITAEKDAGEAFFMGSNAHGFDFYSAHFFVQYATPTLKTLALGDYSARMGQGLLLQTGFSPGKSAETTAIARGGRRLGAYSAFGETFFLRGAAATLSLGKYWEITALFSSRRRDGNVIMANDTIDPEFPDVVFSSLQTSGLHRTSSEIADEKAVFEHLGGLSASHNWNNGQVSVNGLYLAYDKPLQPAEAPYRKFVFTGKRLTGISVDYFWRHRNLYAFGEMARSDNGGLASLHGLLFAAERHVTLAVLHRSLGRNYQSIYAAPFAESSGPGNEQGLYLGADVRFGRKWQINAYADVWKHPWLRFGVGAPSNGSEYLGRIIWTPKRGVSFHSLWQLEIKERDSNNPGYTGLAANRRSRLRFHASYKMSPALELRSRLEWTRFKTGATPGSRGFLAFQEAVFHPLGFPLTGSVRYTIFDTQDYDSRVYTFENDLFAAISIPGFAGRGSRFFVNLSWRANNWLRLESRFEQTILRLAVTDSGQTGRETAWKLQARLRF
ncbi:MAG: helix-hairpin-helix domain-containing protein [Saprospirales bacterium]|nr:helix-hairpin-helix domain-containing protein [Saprospirales bacterium]